ncbi:hypothetical protein Micbo1qcDRAFT_106472, partial [Microdochium bolleyi]
MAPPKGGFAPNLDKFLDSLKSRPVDASVENLISLIKRRQIQGSEACAIATARVLLQVVARDKWSDVDQLVGRVQLVGKKLVAAQPRELVTGNIVRRVLGLIRDEASEDRNENESASQSFADIRDAEPSVPPSPVGKGSSRPPMFNTRTQSMYNLLSDPDSNGAPWSGLSTPGYGSGTSTPLAQGPSTNVSALKSEIIDGIEEIMDEIKQVDEQILAYSEIVIHPGEYVLVHQPSRTVQRFLARAASKRKFTVLLAVDPSSNASPEDEDQYAPLRKAMATSGGTLVTVMNTGFMAYMSMVNKVIMGARAITAKGGVLVDSGAAVIARAAHELGRPVVVLAGVYKLSPESQFNQESIIEWGTPSKYVNFSDGALVKSVRIRNAVSEFVPGELVDSYITNLGAHSRDHLHSIISDHYKEEDLSFDFW